MFQVGVDVAGASAPRGAFAMWTTLFTVVLVLAAALNILAIVTDSEPPES
jgi:hypothetical protein